MASVIPFFINPLATVLPSPFNDTWGVLVCIGFVVGLEVARARTVKEGLDVRDVVDGIVAIVGCGFLFGHLVNTLVYHPEQMEKNGPIVLLQLWAGQSSFGGFLGAVVGSLLFYKGLRKRPWLQHTEMILYGFPFGWIFGRLGCFTAHDHIGRLTTFPLGVAFPCQRENPTTFQVRFDLGLLEALWTAVIAITFFAASRTKRPTGFYIAAWCLMYAPARFLLDFLRNNDLPDPKCYWVSGALQDVRWGGLTPAQYGCIVMLGLGLWTLSWMRSEAARAPSSPEAG